MKPQVYIETSIPSFYFETRTEPEMLARKEWTRQCIELQNKYQARLLKKPEEETSARPANP